MGDQLRGKGVGEKGEEQLIGSWTSQSLGQQEIGQTINISGHPSAKHCFDLKSRQE